MLHSPCPYGGRGFVLCSNVAALTELHMIAIVLTTSTAIIETLDDCDNVGPACYGCPAYDSCEHHFDEAEG